MALQGRGRCSGVSLGLGSRGTVQNLGLATAIHVTLGTLSIVIYEMS